MEYKVTWTATAKDDYIDTVDYLLERWGRNPTKNFMDAVQRHLKHISRMPKMFPLTEVRENVRRCLVVKQIALYYTFNQEDGEIVILRFYGTRQDPKKLKGKLQDSDL